MYSSGTTTTAVKCKGLPFLSKYIKTPLIEKWLDLEISSFFVNKI